ncbi:MAG: hypothetical protein E7635_04775 [Ruminococcaceae bacterium]|nr:hypothetical protein [Oscillospiraceae bacterium]
MQIDNNIKNSLLSLDDKSLKNVINSLAGAAGMNNSKINISNDDLIKLRTVIKNATDKDANEALSIIGDEKARHIIEEARKRGETE